MVQSSTQFELQVRPRLIFGAGAIGKLGELAAELSARRALVVTDPGIIQAGHVERGVASLQRSGLEVTCFDGTHENPTTEHVDQGVKMAMDFRPDLLVGLGGGSSMDCAKGINFIYSCGGRMQDYWGIGKATKDMLPMIAVPTTAGTGSEMQSFALISDAQTHVKMACGDPRAAFRIALLDPELTLTQPADITALTAVDALSHALETYVTKPRNPASLLFSREAWRLISGHILKVFRQPDDLDARAALQLGAAYAGTAIEHSMLGASHALANPLTARYGISHGQAVGIMLPHVIRYNGQEVGAWYDDLLASTNGELVLSANGAAGASGKTSRSVGALSQFVDQVLHEAGLQTNLRDLGVEREHMLELAEAAEQQWTGKFNPRTVDRRALLQLYEQAF